jgi:hypothetical protein
MLVYQELFVDSIPIKDDEGPGFFAVIDDLQRAINRRDLLAQEMPAEMGFTGRLPTCTGSSIEDDFHYDLLSLLAKDF